MQYAKTHKSLFLAVLVTPFLLGLGSNAHAVDLWEEDFLLKLLGKYAFFDTDLSNPRGSQACASCHDSAAGGSHPISEINAGQVVADGANGALGLIRTPTNTYASFSQPLWDNRVDGERRCGGAGGICGGNFWNGRAQGRRNSIHAPDYDGAVSAHIGPEVCQGLPDTRCVDSYLVKYEKPISDQALNPFNPLEQNIERWEVCERVRDGEYAELFELAWGVAPDCRTDIFVEEPGLDVLNETPADITFKRVAMAIGAFQHSPEVNPFSSKRDLALRAELRCLEGEMAGARWVRWSPTCRHPDYLGSKGDFPLAGLTSVENLGHDLFYNDPRTANFRPDLPPASCSECHAERNLEDTGAEPEQLYTDQAFHNLGVPFNPELAAFPDVGLMGMTGSSRHISLFRTPTVRNVDKRPDDEFVKAYMHNGYFKTLEGVVRFYNTAFLGNCVIDEAADPPELCDGRRDVVYEDTTAARFGITRCPGPMTEAEALAANCWPEPEWPDARGAPTNFVGDLGMDEEHEAALVAYMKALSDIRTVTDPLPYSSIEQLVRLLARFGVVE